MSPPDLRTIAQEAEAAGIGLTEAQKRYLAAADVSGTADILVGDAVGRLLEAKVAGSRLSTIIAEIRSPAALLGTAGSVVTVLLAIAEPVSNNGTIDEGLVIRELREEAEAILELPYDIRSWNDLDASVVAAIGFDSRTDDAARLFAEALSLIAAALAIHATAAAGDGRVATGYGERGFTWSEETYSVSEQPSAAFRAALRLL